MPTIKVTLEYTEIFTEGTSKEDAEINCLGNAEKAIRSTTGLDNPEFAVGMVYSP